MVSSGLHYYKRDDPESWTGGFMLAVVELMSKPEFAGWRVVVVDLKHDWQGTRNYEVLGSIP